jgi:hypothetical protein
MLPLGRRSVPFIVAAVSAASVLASQGGPPPMPLPSGLALRDALDVLAHIKRDAPVRVQVGYTWQVGADGVPGAALWVSGELDPTVVARDDPWMNGAEFSADVLGENGAPAGGGRWTLTRESRSALMRLPVPGTVVPGLHAVRVSSRPVDGAATLTDTVSVRVPQPPAPGAPAGAPVLFRRGPFSGPTWMPVGDPRFRRQERVKVEVPVLGVCRAGAVRLLDRTGHPLNLPVTSSQRDEDGVQIVAGELTLAPLATGDYVLEVAVTGGEKTVSVLSAFRIVP